MKVDYLGNIDHIKQLLSDCGITQAALARHTGFPASLVSHLLNPESHGKLLDSVNHLVQQRKAQMQELENAIQAQ